MCETFQVMQWEKLVQQAAASPYIYEFPNNDWKPNPQNFGELALQSPAYSYSRSVLYELGIEGKTPLREGVFSLYNMVWELTTNLTPLAYLPPHDQLNDTEKNMVRRFVYYCEPLNESQDFILERLKATANASDQVDRKLVSRETVTNFTVHLLRPADHYIHVRLSPAFALIRASIVGNDSEFLPDSSELSPTFLDHMWRVCAPSQHRVLNFLANFAPDSPLLPAYHQLRRDFDWAIQNGALDQGTLLHQVLEEAWELGSPWLRQ